MSLATAFASSARRHGEKTAVFWGTAEHTYGQVLAAADRVAWRLGNQHAVQPGDRVGVWLRNCPEYISALFGTWLAGGIAVPINSFLKPEEVRYILSDAGVKVLFAEASVAEGLTAAAAGRALPVLVPPEPLVGGDGAWSGWPAPAVGDDALAVIIYTSGTTGHPKGAMLSHGNLLHNVEGCRQVLAAVDHDRFVLVLPMFHSFMLTVCILLPLLVGGSIVLIKSLHPPKNVLNEILRCQGTILPAIPPLFRTLAQVPSLPGRFPLRLCVSGAAPLPAQVIREFNRRFPIPLLEGYGLSEASPVVSMMPLAGPLKAGSIGVPIPGVEMSVQDEAGRLLPVSETGEVCVRGGNVMQGYWNRPEESAAVLRDGWLHTGDVGHRDADGYFYITDRKKDMLLVNGMNVYPREIEEVAYGFPGIKEVAVIGCPDPRKGEQPVAFVTPEDGRTVDAAALIEFLRGRLADYKVPRQVHLIGALPRNATGKILKARLREILAAG